MATPRADRRREACATMAWKISVNRTLGHRLGLDQGRCSGSARVRSGSAVRPFDGWLLSFRGQGWRKDCALSPPPRTARPGPREVPGSNRWREAESRSCAWPAHPGTDSDLGSSLNQTLAVLNLCCKAKFRNYDSHKKSIRHLAAQQQSLQFVLHAHRSRTNRLLPKGSCACLSV